MLKINFSGHNKIWRCKQNLWRHCPECPPVATGLIIHFYFIRDFCITRWTFEVIVFLWSVRHYLRKCTQFCGEVMAKVYEEFNQSAHDEQRTAWLNIIVGTLNTARDAVRVQLIAINVKFSDSQYCFNRFSFFYFYKKERLTFVIPLYGIWKILCKNESAL